MNGKKISLILNIISIALMVFALIFGIVNIVGSHNAVAGIVDEAQLVQIRQPYGKRIIFGSCVCFGIAIIVNLAATILFVNDCSRKEETLVLIKLGLAIFPLILATLILAIFYFAG